MVRRNRLVMPLARERAAERVKATGAARLLTPRQRRAVGRPLVAGSVVAAGGAREGADRIGVAVADANSLLMGSGPSVLASRAAPQCLCAGAVQCLCARPAPCNGGL